MTGATIEATSVAGEQVATGQPGQTGEEARAALASVEGRIAEWEGKRDDLARRLAGKESAAAAAALAGASTAKVAGEVAGLREQLAVAEGALVLLDHQRQQAARAVRAARLADEERAIDALEAELAGREARYRELAGPLEEFEGLPAGTLVIGGITAQLAQALNTRRNNLADLRARLEDQEAREARGEDGNR